MIPSQDPTFIWLHIKKAAGQSIRAALEDVYVQTDRSKATPFIALPKREWNDNLNNFRIPLGGYDYRRMLFARTFLFPATFDDMFKFCVVRNPYTRAVSSFLYEIKNNRKHKAATRTFPKRMFRRYLHGLPEVWQKTKPRHRALHSAQVIPDITDTNGVLLVDFVARVESISADLNYICDRLGIARRSAPQANRLGGRVDPLQFYDTTNRRLVEQLYQQDIDRFGYRFPTR
jgi:hypothetical protein